MPDLWPVVARARRHLLRHRRVLSALLAGVAVLVIMQTVAPDTPSRASVVVAAHDLTSGMTLSSGDVAVRQVPPALVPAGSTSSLAAVVGSVVAGPMRAGEAVTDRRLLSAPLISGYPPGLVAAPVRIRDAAVVDLIGVGDHISVYAARDDTSYADLVVDRAAVVTLPRTDDSQQGGLVVLAVTPDQAAALAQASATAPLTVTLLR